jgi:uncharacterized protein (DUF1778 family)
MRSFCCEVLVAKRTVQPKPKDDAKDTISFSVRLTEQQRSLLEKAATAKGWTITNLLKNAALEKAAYILNTSSPNRVDFRQLARAVAVGVFAPREVYAVQGEESVDITPVASFYDLPPELEDGALMCEVSPWHMPPSFAAELREAARYGGTEFLNLILEAAEGIATEKPKDLPNPVDPSAV